MSPPSPLRPSRPSRFRSGVRPDRGCGKSRIDRRAQRACGRSRGVRPRRGPALARASRRGHGDLLGGRRRALHGRPRDRGRRAGGSRDRPRRHLHRLHRRRQHQPDDRADRQARLRRRPGRGAHHGSRSRRLVRRAGARDHLSDEDRHRAVHHRGERLMYAIIAGGGKVGWNLARELMGKGHEVTLIENDRNRYLTVEQELEHVAQYGDATELWVLERAGIQRAELVVAVTGDDEDNILICQIAREKYLCDRIIARVNNPRNRRWFELLDIQPAVSATDLILRLIEHEVPSYGLVHLLDLRDEKLEIIEVEVTDGAPAAGQLVSAVDLPDGALIISVLREDGGFVPKSDTMIEAGDEVLLVLDPGLEDAIMEQFAPNGGRPGPARARGTRRRAPGSVRAGSARRPPPPARPEPGAAAGAGDYLLDRRMSTPPNVPVQTVPSGAISVSA